MVAQGIEHVAGGVKAGRDAVGRNREPVGIGELGLCDRALIVLQCALEILLADDAKAQRCGIRSLGVLNDALGIFRHACLRVDEELVPGFTGKSRSIAIGIGLFRLAERLEHGRSLIETGDIYGVAKAHTVGRDAGQMVTERTSLAGQALVGLLVAVGVLILQRRVDQVVDIGADVVDVVAHDGEIAGLHKEIVRDRHHQAVPGDAEALALVGDDIVVVEIIVHEGRAVLGGKAGRAAVGTHGIHPLTHECVGIGHIRTGERVDLRVAGPAHALVALRAVGRDRDIVACGRVHDIRKELVDQRIRALIGRARIQRREHLLLHVLHRQRFIETRDLDIAVAVEGQVGRNDILALLHRVEIRRQRGAEVFHHQQAVDARGGILFELRIEDFGKAERDRVAGFCQLGRDRDQRDTGDVLPHIIEIRAGALFRLTEEFDGLRRANDMHRLVIARDKTGILKLLARFDHAGRCPGRVVKAGLRPADNRGLFGRVVALALEEGGESDRTVGEAFPVFRVGDDGLLCAVGIGHNQHGHQRALIAVIVVVGGFKRGHTCPPAFAEHRAHRVLAGDKVFRDIIDVIGQDRIVLGGAGVEPGIRSDLPAVDVEIIHALRSEIETGLLDLPRKCEAAAQHRSGGEAGIGIGEDTVFTATDRYGAAIYAQTVKPVKDGVGRTAVLVQQGTAGIFSAVGDGIIGKDRALTGIDGKTDTAEHRIGVDLRRTKRVEDDFVGVQHRAVEADSKPVGRAIEIDMVGLVSVL